MTCKCKSTDKMDTEETVRGAQWRAVLNSFITVIATRGERRRAVVSRSLLAYQLKVAIILAFVSRTQNATTQSRCLSVGRALPAVPRRTASVTLVVTRSTLPYSLVSAAK